MTFADLMLHETLLRAVAEEGYDVPTPIQSAAIPHVLNGVDLLGCAQTGTGKTAAFALPILQRLSQPASTQKRRRIRALVLTPTRELAVQILDSFETYGRHCSVRSTVVYGGVRQRPQVAALTAGVDVLIATPGRLMDLMGQGYVDLQYVDHLVLDEADNMLDMGFINDIRRIISYIPNERQTLLFSATMPREIRALANSILRDPIEVKVTPVASAPDTVDQMVYFVERVQKPAMLVDFLKNNAVERALVFTQTKQGADRVVAHLNRSGVHAEVIHGDCSQGERSQAMANFKSDEPPVLVATDIAARGLDIDAISHVVNYDVPLVSEQYVHRIGRTGRAGATGIAVMFCNIEERRQLRDIERLTGKPIRVEPMPDRIPSVSHMLASYRGEKTPAVAVVVDSVVGEDGAVAAAVPDAPTPPVEQRFGGFGRNGAAGGIPARRSTRRRRR